MIDHTSGGLSLFNAPDLFTKTYGNASCSNGQTDTPCTSTNIARHLAMFSVIELRLIRHAVSKTMENLKSRLKILDRESDEAVEATNDLVLYKGILEKIKAREDV